MLGAKPTYAIVLLSSAFIGLSHSVLSQSGKGSPPSSSVAVSPQYDSTHVYVSPSEIDAFVTSFLGTFGGTTTKQVSVTVTPTPSVTISQLLQTPVGTVSLFGFKTPIPFPFGAERTGYLVTDMDAAIKAARASGADVVVSPFPDPIGVDAVIQWPGGIMTQIYWHAAKPSYPPFAKIPENRAYVSADRVDAFLHSFLAFSNGRIVSDQPNAPGSELGLSNVSVRRVSVESRFGKLLIFVTDGHLPYPYGRETTGYEVEDLTATLAKAVTLGVKILVPLNRVAGRTSAMVQFPGGYIAEVHSTLASVDH